MCHWSKSLSYLLMCFPFLHLGWWFINDESTKTILDPHPLIIAQYWRRVRRICRPISLQGPPASQVGVGGVPSVIIIGRLSIIHPSHVASVILIRKLSIISILSTISHHHVKRKEPEYNVITLIANRAFSSSNILTMILNISNIRSFYFEFCCSTTGAAFPF